VTVVKEDPSRGELSRGELTPDELSPDELSSTFAALADPTRRAIVARLAAGEATAGQLAEPFALTQQAISKHLKVLEQAGLISRSRAAQRRPCRLRPDHLDAAAAWIERHRRAWAERYDRLDEHLAALRDAAAGTAAPGGTDSPAASPAASPALRPGTEGEARP
jgi:DNA-binding transcriptional ArsR family regulator